MRRNIFILWIVAGFFISVIGTLIVTHKQSPHIEEIPNLDVLLTSEIQGWSASDLPVGETEEVKRKMGELLNYDSAIHRVYKRGLMEIHVYLSYWRPGKAHFRNVYGHTPDVCWPLAGWQPTVRDPAYLLTIESDPILKFKTAQYREFALEGKLLRVLFWQLLDGEPFTYGNYGLAPLSSAITDVFMVGFHQMPEQWFIRVSANVDFERLQRDEGFKELMRSVSQFGLLKEKNKN